MWGRYARVTHIYGRGLDIKGKAYVCFYTENGESSTISGSYKEDELVRMLPLSRQYSSHELTLMERQLVAAR